MTAESTSTRAVSPQSIGGGASWRISSSDSPFTLVQQRLGWATRSSGRQFTNIIETVPRWPEFPPFAQASLSDIGDYGPCAGQDELIARIRERECRIHGVSLEADEVLVTNGALHGISLVLRELASPGSRALCQAPALASIASLFLDSGYELQFFGASDGSIDLEELRQQCARGLSLIYINTPHNPTGAVCDQRTLKEVVGLAAAHDAVLIADMVYDGFPLSEPIVSPLRVDGNWSRIYVVNSMSKNYGAPGLRIGWLLSSADNVSQVAGALERECIAVSGVSQRCAESLLRHGNHSLVARVQENNSWLLSRIQGKGWEFHVPRGGTQLWMELPIADVEAFADYMLVEFGLLLATAGNYAGTERPCIRIPIGAPMETLERAIGLIGEGLIHYPCHRKESE